MITPNKNASFDSLLTFTKLAKKRMFNFTGRVILSVPSPGISMNLIDYPKYPRCRKMLGNPYVSKSGFRIIKFSDIFINGENSLQFE